MRRSTTILFILAALLALLAMPAVAQEEASAEPAASATPTTEPLPTAIPASDGPTVQAVFYFSPTCGHCHYVITEILPGLFAQNGGDYVVTFDQSVLPGEPAFYLLSNGRLQLLLVDVTQADGAEMYVADAELLGLDEPPGVPLLHIRDEWYVGSGDIPEHLPRLVVEGLADDGIDWPPAPGIEVALAPFLAEGSVAAPSTSEDDEIDETVALPIGSDEGPLDKIGNDPVGNGVSIVVLLLLIVSLIAAPILAARGSLPAFPGWLVIPLVVVGIGVALYLASIETSGSEAVCGPVGDCNAVQESEYASVLGVPIGVLGVIGYLLIGGLWLVSRFSQGSISDWADLLVALGAFGGTLFSAYLTFLEPFVIGATCMWCITSALVMVALLWISAGPGWAAFERLRGDGEPNPQPAG